MSFETILLDVDASDHVATITLNRPDALNAFNRTMCEEMAEAWRIVKLDDSVNAVVLRAAATVRSVPAWTSSPRTVNPTTSGTMKTPARSSARSGRRCGNRSCVPCRVCAQPGRSTSSTNPTS
jgi:hypothetical protein